MNPINYKNPRISKVTDISAGQFHSAVIANGELITWGLNAGQLGHVCSTSDGPLLTEPRIVGSINDADISSVRTSAAATLAFSHENVYVCSLYGTLRLRGLPSNAVIKDVSITGGWLDKSQRSNMLPNWWERKTTSEFSLMTFSSKPEILDHTNPVRVVLLTEQHGLFYWEQTTNVLTQQTRHVASITFTSSFVLKFDQLGTVQVFGNRFLFNYENHGTVFEAKLNGWRKCFSKKKKKTGNDSWQSTSSSENPTERQNMLVSVKRLENIHRVNQVFASPNGAVLGVGKVSSQSLVDFSTLKDIDDSEWFDLEEDLISFDSPSLQTEIALGSASINIPKFFLKNTENLSIRTNIPSTACFYLLNQAKSLWLSNECELLDHCYYFPVEIQKSYFEAKFLSESELDLESTGVIYEDFCNLIKLGCQKCGFTFDIKRFKKIAMQFTGKGNKRIIQFDKFGQDKFVKNKFISISRKNHLDSCDLELECTDGISIQVHRSWSTDFFCERSKSTSKLENN